MKLYKNLVTAVADTVRQIVEEHRYADKALERLLKSHPQWGSRDRRFVAEGVYDIIRNFRLYTALAQTERNYWFIASVWLLDKGTELPDWPEFRDVNPDAILKQKEKFRSDKPVFESWPDWLWKLASEEIGESNWEREARALNEPAKVVLRMNTLKASPESFERAMKLERVEVVKTEREDCYLLAKRENVFKLKAFREGLFEVQDAGSQDIGRFVNPVPGEMVIDACAGAGGKSLHLAALMKNKGKILSLDVEERKLEELRKRAKRAGAYNIEAKTITNQKTINGLKERGDRVLLDVPCTGLGVVKRNPDTKWKLSPELIEKTRQLQYRILEEYSVTVKKQGSLFYSTCSILPSENSEQIKKFLGSHDDFIFVKENVILPSEGFDGFYMCELKKIR